MGSLHALRRGSLATVLLVFGFLSFLLLLIVVVVDYFLSFAAYSYALLVVVGLASFFMFLQWAISPAIVRWAIRGRRPITAESNPWVHRTVAELARGASVPMPRVWMSEDAAPNAFVFGRTVSSSELVVTRALLEQLNQDEIRAVLAHEIGHLRHRDVVIMTWVSAVPLLAYVLARVGFEVLRGTKVSSKDGKGAGAVILTAVAVAILSYVIYLVTQLLVLYLSRTREYYADAYSGTATKDPHQLASALAKITFGQSLARGRKEPSGLRAFFIGDPVKAADDYRTLQQKMAQYDLNRDGQIDRYELEKAVATERRNPWNRANELFSTHPPIYKRILMLEELEEEILQSGVPANAYKFV